MFGFEEKQSQNQNQMEQVIEAQRLSMRKVEQHDKSIWTDRYIICLKW